MTVGNAPQAPPEQALEEEVGRNIWWIAPARVLASFAIPVVAFVLLWITFEFLRDSDANRGVIVLVALVVGVVGVFGLYWGMDFLVDQLPLRFREQIRPYAFVGPAIVILSVYLVYPAVNTTIISFMDATSDSFIGFENYGFVFTDAEMLRSLRNTVGWIIVVPAFSVGIGLLFATLADRLRRGEALSKALIFLPMAISFVGAAIVWRFVYNFRPEGFGNQIGLLNGALAAVDAAPVAWITEEPWNNLLLMVIMIWMQTGFAMVILSAGIKAVPTEILEAARIDGATEIQVFWRVIIPSIMSTIVVVTTTMVINVLKVFDIVWVMTGGRFGTEVVAERMIRWFFRNGHNGRGAAIAVVLFLAIIPIMLLNVKRFREEEAIR